MPPLNPSHRRAAAAALALALTAAADAQAQGAPMLRNDYNLWALMPPAEAWLDSYVDCGVVRCDIAYRIMTQPVDRYVQVVWKDRAGSPLVTGSNDYLSNFWNPVDFGGYIQAVEWSKGALGSALFPPTPPHATGTADFTGTGPGSDPCGTGYVCTDAEYYYWPKVFGPSSQPVPPAPGRNDATLAAPVLLGSVSGTLSNVGVDPLAPEGVGDRRVEFVSFSSSVEVENGLYTYTYSVTNLTDLSVPFTWSAAELDGQLDPFGTAQRSVTSNLAPTLSDSQTFFSLSTGGVYPLVANFNSGLELLVPVPEPGTWAQMLFGLSLLASAAHRRRRTPAGAA